MAAEQNTPTRRALKFATMGAGVAGSYLGYILQRAFVGEAKSQNKLKSTHAKAARRMRDDFQTMRGPAMKLGQTLSLQAGLLPDETLAELASLQMEAPGMHPSLVGIQIKRSLGKEPEEIFAKFEPKPFAAASLGQVHHARTHSGENVVVKIQYPGIRETVENDFKWFRKLTKPAQASGHLPKHAIDEMERQMIAETDYRTEADNIEFFQKSLAPLPFVTVPRVLRALSSEKVLTMSFVQGRHLQQFLERRPSQKVRDQLGTNLFDLFYFQILNVGAFHADPHWGNYLFNDDATIGLIDFGCAKYLPAASANYRRRMYLFPGDRNSTEFRKLLEQYYQAEGMKLSTPTRRALISFADQFYRKVYPPDASKGFVFDFSSESFLKDYVREATKLFRTKGMMTELIFMARTEMGLYHTLHRLRARVRTSEIVRKYL
jgi:predicted unusual protein kinase regulating ubiquinone biosynthesis (AarF/ABC1/UbiB family)